jgi:sigma-B regulation protein RsbU (phosphoserine phosphatase)
MAGMSALVIYRQFGAHLVYQDVQGKLERLEAIANDVHAAASTRAAERDTAIRRILAAAENEFPGIGWKPEDARRVLARKNDVGRDRFLGLVQRGKQVWLLAALEKRATTDRQVIGIAAPLNLALLERVVPNLGPVQVIITRPAGASDDATRIASLGDLNFVSLDQLSTRSRALPPSTGFLDWTVTGLSKLETMSLSEEGVPESKSILFASVTSRTSVLNRQLFDAPGDVGSLFARGLRVIGVLFLILEGAALVTGINLSRTITGAVDDLYSATRRVQEGDFSYRVRVARNDQLGALGESFNSMTGSITDLIEEQRQRQRLENELSIAKEVQSQLFPQEVPRIPGVELYANCRAARMVSGDYYDFIQLDPNRVAFVIADISGKGISAALLMASLQAALRSQLLLDSARSTNTAELVVRLNRHLFLNTSPDRYATLFFAIYDTSTRTLAYTNAGHLPPILVVGDKWRKLEEGGMVVGLFDEFSYEQGTIQIQPGSLLVAYSDGLTEPENAYGEQFGIRRLSEEVMRHRWASPQDLAERLFSAAEDWAGTLGQADDMTVLVARLS